jgi:hypothetical protein
MPSNPTHPALSVVPPVPVDDTPPRFMFLVATGDVDQSDAALLAGGVLTVRAEDPLPAQLGAIEQMLRHLHGQRSELRPVNAPAEVTA